MLAECELGLRVLAHPLGTSARLGALLDGAMERPLPELIAGRYRIESLIGQGGMATVYAARDTHYRNRRVAVKVLTAEVAHAVTRERFLREIETGATLTHPNIVPLYDSGESEGFLFYVMPVIRGQSLRNRLQRERQLPIAEAIRIATNI